MSTLLDKLFKDLLSLQASSQKTLPPVEKWNPKLSGDMDLIIDGQGRWIHEGDEIKRPSLVKLFSSILKQEGDEYFLVTPIEKWRIQVEVAPFYITNMEVETRDGERALLFKTNTDDLVVASKSNPLMVVSGNSEPIPLITVRNGMQGLLSRNVFYQLVDLAEIEPHNGQQLLVVRSLGEPFILGEG